MELNYLLKSCLKNESAITPPLENDDQIKKINQFFYHEPSVSEVDIPETYRIILFSAPGAVGKSALAKYISYRYNGLYWNIADTRIGDGSFSGVINKAIGRKHMAETERLFGNLANGNALIVLDSFDEAALMSGCEGIRIFLSEIHDVIGTENTPATPSVILTARTETASLIVNLCADIGISLAHYSVDYFTELSAVDFVCRYIQEELNCKTVSEPWKRHIEEYLHSFKEYLGDDADAFIGYAPVLQVISKQIHGLIIEGKNPTAHSVKNTIDNTSNTRGKIILSIVELLIQREKGKFDPFRDLHTDKYVNAPETLDNLYDKDEQLTRLLWYILLQDVQYGNYPSSLRPEDIDEYGNSLASWLPQHVFITGKDIGEVFRDYMTAEVMLDTSLKSLMGDWEGYITKSLRTRALIDCYMELSDKVFPEHIQLLCESFASGIPVGFVSLCYISELDSDELSIRFVVRNASEVEKTVFEAKLSCEGSLDLNLTNVSNLFIDVPGIVRITGVNGLATLRNCFVECDDIEIEASRMIFTSYSRSEKCRLIARRSIIQTSGALTVMDGGNIDTVQIGFPPDCKGIYRLEKYRCVDFEDTADGFTSLTAFVYVIKKILEQFRADKYDGIPRKYKEKIDARIKGQARRNILNYLMHIGIISEESQFYCCNLSRMSDYGISYIDYMQLQEDKFVDLRNEYISWLQQNALVE